MHVERSNQSTITCFREQNGGRPARAASPLLSRASRLLFIFFLVFVRADFPVPNPSRPLLLPRAQDSASGPEAAKRTCCHHTYTHIHTYTYIVCTPFHPLRCGANNCSWPARVQSPGISNRFSLLSPKLIRFPSPSAF